MIPHRFFDLFKGAPERILAQIGLVSLSERYWRSYEPGAPSPAERLENIQRLKKIGITPGIRIDPIIPFVTDTQAEIGAVLGKLKGIGIERVTLSYLHLRPAIQEQLMRELSPLHQRLIEACFKAQQWKTIGSSTKTKLLPTPIREKGYARIKKAAESFGITALICQCKNPDLKGDLCSSGRVRTLLHERKRLQLPLFRC